MKNLFIVANWKENKTVDSAIKFLEEFKTALTPREDITTVICPPFTLVPMVSEFIKTNNLSIEVGVQNISSFEEGAHTGEISAAQAAEFASYVIVGHSERRAIGETDDVVARKSSNATAARLTPILCVQGGTTPVPPGVKLVAYEPVEAIGTGNPDTPGNAQKVAAAIKEKNSGVVSVLYGGSVTSENVINFTNMPDISGVLVGSSSLDPYEFSSIIKNA